MKKNISSLILSALSFCSVLNAHATTHLVTVAFGFYPAVFSANIGDTVKWIYFKGGPHTTTSTTIPSGAASWDAPLVSGGQTFSYPITVAGTYSYQCTDHAFDGEIAKFTVAPPTTVNEHGLTISSIAFPNPFIDKLTISCGPGLNLEMAVSIFNIAGEKIRNIELMNGQTIPIGIETEIDMSSFPSGVYFYCISKEGIIIEARRIIKI